MACKSPNTGNNQSQCKSLWTTNSFLLFELLLNISRLFPLVNFWMWNNLINLSFNSAQFSHSVMSDSLWPHGLQHTRLPCPSPTPRVYSNSCPLSWWCHPTISSSLIPFSSHLQSFTTSGSFPMSQFFTSGNWSIRASASASVLQMNIQDWFPLGLTG